MSNVSLKRSLEQPQNPTLKLCSQLLWCVITLSAHSFEIEEDPVIGHFHVGSRTRNQIRNMTASLLNRITDNNGRADTLNGP